MSRVAIIRCGSYDFAEVRNSVQRGIDLLGGAGRFAGKGEKILLKPNLLIADPPEKCVTTHPSVFRAAAEIFLSTGAILSYGDSPSIGSTAGAAKKAGLAAVAEDLGIALADFKNGEEIVFDKGRQNKKFTIARGILESEGVISLPKLKTHGLMRFTGAVKNQFGCIPGTLKAEFHLKIPDPFNFAQMLVDLNMFVKPRLYIMDGIQAMEGNGPRGGKPVKMNVLLLSEDPVALDAVVCRMLGMDPEFVPTMKAGMDSGMGTFLEDEIELAGDDLGQFFNDRFDIKRLPKKHFSGKGISRFINNRIISRPYIIEDKCEKCGICVDICPAEPKALAWGRKGTSMPPVYDYDTCIRCYCCQEVCPESAIHLKVPFLRRILRG